DGPLIEFGSPPGRQRRRGQPRRFQVRSGAELQAAHEQLVAAGRGVTAEKNANCCYALSDKYWVTDPAGVAWETFHTLGSIPVYGSDSETATSACGTGASACCAADAKATGESSHAAQAGCCSATEDAAEKSGCCA